MFKRKLNVFLFTSSYAVSENNTWTVRCASVNSGPLYKLALPIHCKDSRMSPKGRKEEKGREGEGIGEWEGKDREWEEKEGEG